jgi:hypothetical protein
MFKPTISQLCAISELSNARASIATIARELHITAEDFIAWRQQCMLAAADEAARLQSPEPLARREPVERQARMTAATLFEMPDSRQARAGGTGSAGRAN